jgi:nitrogen-specific signal transduction histidine kinase
MSLQTSNHHTAMQATFVAPSKSAQSVNMVPSAWRFIVLPNLSGGSYKDMTAQVRIDQAHGTNSPLAQFNWTTDVGSNLGEVVCAGPIMVSVEHPSTDSIPSGSNFHSLASKSDELLEAQLSSPELAGNHFQLKSMLAEAAHDIRAPLGVARQILHRITTQIRGEGKLTHDDIDLLDSASTRLQQATAWVDDILVPSKLAGASESNIRQRFYPHQLLNIVRPIVDHLAEQKKVKIDWSGWDRSLPRLYLDANKLSRVMLNLIENAINASAADGTVHVKVTWQNNVTQRLVIAIEDEAQGLPKTLLQFVNGKYFSTLPNEVGIGLQTVKSLSQALGTVSAQVVPRGGTLFRITVPVDNRLALIRSWLLHSARGPARPGIMSSRIGLVLLRSVDLDTAKVDLSLQQKAAMEDFIYRVSNDRWLWLTTSNKRTEAEGLNELRESIEIEQEFAGKMFGQLVCEWPNVDLRNLHSASDARNLLPQLSASISKKFDELAGNRVPPIDQLQSGLSSSLQQSRRNGHQQIVRIDRPRQVASVKHKLAQIDRMAAQPNLWNKIDLLHTDPDVFSKVSLRWDETDASD